MPENDLPDTDSVRNIMGAPVRTASADITEKGSRGSLTTGQLTVSAGNVTIADGKTGQKNRVADVSDRILETLRAIYGKLDKPSTTAPEQLQQKVIQRMFPQVTEAAKKGKLTISDLLTAQPDNRFTQGFEPDQVMELVKLMTINNFKTGKIGMQDPRTSRRVTGAKVKQVSEMLKVMATGKGIFGTSDFNEQIELMNQLRMGTDRVDGTIYKTPPRQLQEKLYGIETLARKSRVEPESIVSGLLQSQRYINATAGRLVDPITGRRESPGNTFGTAMRIEEEARKIAKRAGRSDEEFVGRIRNNMTDIRARAAASNADDQAVIMEHRRQTGVAGTPAQQAAETKKWEQIQIHGTEAEQRKYVTDLTGYSTTKQRDLAKQLRPELNAESQRRVERAGKLKQERMGELDLHREFLKADRDIYEDSVKGVEGAKTWEQHQADIDKSIKEKGYESPITSGVRKGISRLSELGSGEKWAMREEWNAKVKEFSKSKDKNIAGNPEKAALEWAGSNERWKPYVGTAAAPGIIGMEINKSRAYISDIERPGADWFEKTGSKFNRWARERKTDAREIFTYWNTGNLPFMGASDEKLITGYGFTDKARAVGSFGALKDLLWNRPRQVPISRLRATAEIVKQEGKRADVDQKEYDSALKQASTAKTPEEILAAQKQLINVSLGSTKGTGTAAERMIRNKLEVGIAEKVGKIEPRRAPKSVLTENEWGAVGRKTEQVVGRPGNVTEDYKKIARQRVLDKNKLTEEQGKIVLKGGATDTSKPRNITGVLTIEQGQKTYSATLEGTETY